MGDEFRGIYRREGGLLSHRAGSSARPLQLEGVCGYLCIQGVIWKAWLVGRRKKGEVSSDRR